MAIALHIGRLDEAAADRLLTRLEQRLTLLAANPRLGPERPGNVPDLRSFTLRPYLLLYQPLTDGIRPLRVLHGARDISAALDSD